MLTHDPNTSPAEPGARAKLIEAVIFIGIQGTGKTSFYRNRFSETHVRISLDMVRTRNRERLLMRACLEGGQPFVVDNTSLTRLERSRYVGPALEAGFRISGYFFQSRVRDAIQRNRERVRAVPVPDHAIASSSKRLELPSSHEGFDNLYYVAMNAGDFRVEAWHDEL